MAPNRKPISLALQGGGAHGAFAWGVLDRLL
jgi:NTE family protein